jgi:hypothetical protein
MHKRFDWLGAQRSQSVHSIVFNRAKRCTSIEIPFHDKSRAGQTNFISILRSGFVCLFDVQLHK